MATVRVECQGNKWQDDYSAILERVQRYFGACFRGKRDWPDLAAEAQFLVLRDFQRQWQPGQVVRLQLAFAAHDAARGRNASGCRRHHTRLRTNRGQVLRRALAKVQQTLAEVDFRMALARLTPRDREVVELLVAGHSYVEIRRLTGHWRQQAVQAVRRCLALLQS
jgi:DNA-directed RNA polymerase specialized sigma24 family protein